MKMVGEREIGYFNERSVFLHNTDSSSVMLEILQQQGAYVMPFMSKELLRFHSGILAWRFLHRRFM